MAVTVDAPVEERINPSLARHFVRSARVTGLARTAENRVPSSVMERCCSYEVAAITGNDQQRHVYDTGATDLGCFDYGCLWIGSSSLLVLH
jgi:hypothetical protein